MESTKSILFLTIAITPPILWLFYISFIQTTIQGKLAGVCPASLWERIGMGYLGLLLLFPLTMLWSVAIAAWRQ